MLKFVCRKLSDFVFRLVFVRRLSCFILVVIVGLMLWNFFIFNVLMKVGLFFGVIIVWLFGLFRLFVIFVRNL